MKKHWIQICVLGIYICLISFGIWHHEPWRDEAQPWLIARDNSLGEILQKTHTMGTPVLWYAILMPMAQSGLDYTAMAILHVGLASIAAGLLLFYGNIPLATKILFVFSYFIAFEYAVIARLYVLIIVVLFSLAALYAKRFVYSLPYAILVFLLFQITSFSIVPAGVLTLLFGIQLFTEKQTKKHRIIAFAIMLAGAISAFLQLYPAPSYTAAPTDTITEIPVALSQSVIPLSLLVPVQQTSSDIIRIIAIVATCMLFISAIVMMRKNISVLFFTVATTGWWLYVNGIVHAGTARHHGLFLIFLIFAWWVLRADHKNGHIPGPSSADVVFRSVLNVLLIISCLATVKLYVSDYVFNFSGAKDMAQYIKNNVGTSDSIVAFVGSHGEAVLPFLKNRRFWYPELEVYGSNIFPTTAYMMTAYTLSNADVLTKVGAHFPAGIPVLLLLSRPLSDEESHGYTFLHQSAAVYFWSNETESFWLYRRNS